MACFEGLYAYWYVFFCPFAFVADIDWVLAGEVIHAEVLMLPNGMSKVRW
jgi:hypothetical protein